MTWNPSDMERFFGCIPDIHESVPNGTSYFFQYSGKLLVYHLYVYEHIDQVSVSGDPDHPFGFSLFEFYVPCDSITISRAFDDSDQECLQFWDGGHEATNLRLKVVKRADGDLMVWPNYPFSPEHPARKSQTSGPAS